MVNLTSSSVYFHETNKLVKNIFDATTKQRICQRIETPRGNTFETYFKINDKGQEERTLTVLLTPKDHKLSKISNPVTSHYTIYQDGKVFQKGNIQNPNSYNTIKNLYA